MAAVLKSIRRDQAYIQPASANDGSAMKYRLNTFFNYIKKFFSIKRKTKSNYAIIIFKGFSINLRRNLCLAISF